MRRRFRITENHERPERFSDQVEPCPFCQGRDLWVFITRGSSHMECFGCGAEGPIADGENSHPMNAVSRWNYRSVFDQIEKALTDAKSE